MRPIHLVFLCLICKAWIMIVSTSCSRYRIKWDHICEIAGTVQWKNVAEETERGRPSLPSSWQGGCSSARWSDYPKVMHCIGAATSAAPPNLAIYSLYCAACWLNIRETQPQAGLLSAPQKQPGYHNTALFKKHKPPLGSFSSVMSETIKWSLPSPHLPAWTARPSFMGKDTRAYPTGFPNSHTRAGRPQGAPAGRAHPPGCQCPLWPGAVASLSSCLNLLPGRGRCH